MQETRLNKGVSPYIPVDYIYFSLHGTMFPLFLSFACDMAARDASDQRAEIYTH